MGLESVKEEILNSAKEQANSLIAEGRKEASRISKETEKKIEELQRKSEEETKKTLDMIKRQELASAELDSKKAVLEARKQSIENVFEEAKKKLGILDDKRREQIMKKLLDRAKNEIEAASIYCSKRDAKFFKGLTVHAIDIIGGLVAENKEGTIRIDYSFDTILQSIKEGELHNVNKILFGQNA
ncbi:hypothetical protein HYX07_03010 [Candidatus Woesearchaeota archaeon]|nr:hypothetical protein [Candidatus Woesearchaeota archaeon]